MLLRGDWLWLSTLAVITCACGGGNGAKAGSKPPSPDAGPPGPTCPMGLTAASDGQGCVELAAADPCPAGSGPFLGSASCQPVGWTNACPRGMQADPSGWGCLDVSPPTPCTDPTLTEALGQTACVPVGDCAAAFPPANATVFVDASYTAAQLDANHFQGVFTAVQSSPPGSVIAIESGTYVEDVDLVAPMTLVGRCAAKVTIVNPGDNRSGMLIAGAKGVTLRGLTLKGHASAVYVHQGGTVTVEDSIFLANRWMGMYVIDAGSQATLNRVRITGTVLDTMGAAAGLYGWGIGVQQGGSLTVTSSSIVGNIEYGIALGGAGVTADVTGTLVGWQVRNAAGTYGEGIGVGGGATLTLGQSALVDNTTNAIHLQDNGSTATVTESVLRGTALDTAGKNGGGLFVNTGASAKMQSSTIAETAWDGVTVATGSTATITSSVIRGPLPARAGTWGRGVTVASGAHLEIDGSAVVGASALGIGVQDPSTALVQGTLISGTIPVVSMNQPGGGGMGIAAGSGAQVELLGSSLVGNTTLGIISGDAMGMPALVHAEGTLVRGTQADLQQLYGHGAQAVNGGRVELVGCALVGNTEVGLTVALPGGTASVETTVIRGIQKDATGSFGHGLLVVQGGQVTVDASFLRDNPGIGLAFSGSSGVLTGTWVAHNTVGIQAQDGSFVSQSDATDPPATGEVRVSSDTQFTGNGSRLGSGEVPLPKVKLAQ